MIMYKFEYMLEDRDYVAFSIHHMRNSQANKKSLLITRLLILSIFFLVFLRNFLYYAEHSVFVERLIFYVIFSMILCLAMKPLFEFMLKVQIKMAKKEGKLPYDSNIVMEFYEDYFIEITNETESKTKYTKIEKIIFGDKAIYILLSAIQAVIIPYSAFKTERKRHEFESFIKSRTGTTI